MNTRAADGRRGGWRFLMLCLATGASLAPLAAAWAESPGASSGEKFVLPRPAGWKLGFSVSTPALEMLEYVPHGQSVENWRDMITSQVFPNLRDVPLDSYLGRIATAAKSVCEDVTVTPVTTGTVNGYPAAFMAQFCIRYSQTGKGEITLFKVIQGKDNLFVAQRAWRGEPFTRDAMPVSDETYAEWTDFLNQVSVCDARDPERQCPATRK